MTKCAWPDCNEEGTFPAPKSSKDIYDRQYFCQAHIKEFNKRWNGLENMSEDDIFSMQTKATWERPTWKFGIEGLSAKTANFNFQTSEDMFRFFKQRQKEEFLRKMKGGFYTEDKKDPENLPADVKEACTIFNIELPIDTAKLKTKYLSLMKKHHPDVNKGSIEAEEMVKRVNVSYQILKDYIS